MAKKSAEPIKGFKNLSSFVAIVKKERPRLTIKPFGN